MKHTFVLHNYWALGDTVCLSALARDIQLTYPGEYNIEMSGHFKNVFWRNNPHVTVASDNPKGQLIKLEYREGILAAGRGLKKHFLSWFHHSFEKNTGIRVPVTSPKGDIHLTMEEKRQCPPGRYWVVIAGGKYDMTAKIWSTAYWQQTVDKLATYGVRCVQAGGTFTNHYHPTLSRVEQYVGKTQNERSFFSLIYNAEGVICGITAAMHIAAVFDKPCVVIAGGREEPWWEHYIGSETFGPECTAVTVPHRFLHTLGKIDCGVGNMVKGCWRDRTVPIDQYDNSDPKRQARLCRKPVTVSHQAVPECLSMITPDHVVASVMSYYSEGVIPPVQAENVKHFLPVVEPVDIVWEDRWSKQLPATVSPNEKESSEFGVMDHPYIGGKFTLFVLGYGDNIGLIDRCLRSIINSCPRHRYDLRVALNQPSPQVEAFVAGMGNLVTKVYVDRNNRRKYPAMREMFYDEKCPINTPYLCWFDDDSWCRDKSWMSKLSKVIIANHPHQCRLYGAKYIHDLAKVTRTGALRDQWFKDASWWRNVPLHAANGARQIPNGSEIVFVSGGFWALSTETMREADIPDRRLNHNGGDCTIGCQVTQAGYKMVDFSPRPAKAIIAWSDSARRGFREPFPWA